jgi:hypothetical protein
MASDLKNNGYSQCQQRGWLNAQAAEMMRAPRPINDSFKPS